MEDTSRAGPTADLPPSGAEESDGQNANPSGYTFDSTGRRYPCAEYGHRIVVGNKRPKGVPPTVWKGLTSRETARALADREGEGIPPTSSVGVLGATAHENPRPHEPLVDPRGVHVKSSLRNGSKMSNDTREPQPRVVVGVTLRMGQRRNFTMVLVAGVTPRSAGSVCHLSTRRPWCADQSRRKKCLRIHRQIRPLSKSRADFVRGGRGMKNTHGSGPTLHVTLVIQGRRSTLG